MKKSKSLIIARAGITGGLYIVLTLCFAPISFAMTQLRISEMLCILPLFFPECAVGIIIGCFFSNLMLSTPFDVLFGTIASALAGTLTAIVGLKVKKPSLKIILGEIPPILFNAIIVPFGFFVASDGILGYILNVVSVGVGQLLVISILGTFIAIGLQRFYKPSYKSINHTKSSEQKESFSSETSFADSDRIEK